MPTKSYMCKTTTVVFLILGASLSFDNCSAQKTTVRPYQFAFEIAEQQHRSEKRDENGIVMGEFGFITADGIYHVTVYATDEEGRFKILSMKNFPYSKMKRIMQVLKKPTFTSNKTTAKPRSIKRPAVIATAKKTTIKSPSMRTIKPTIATTTTKPLPRVSYVVDACSGCSLRNPKSGNRNKVADQPENNEDMGGIDLRFGGNDYELGAKPQPVGSPNLKVNPSSKRTQVTNSGPLEDDGAVKSKSAISTRPIPDNGIRQLSPNLGKVVPSVGKKAATNAESAGKNTNSNPDTASFSRNGEAARRKINTDGNFGDDLYRFKYLLNYNGHSETGKHNGNKVGNFHSISSDNVKHSIEYIANEFGYQPHVMVDRGLANVPSKDNALKEYEFVWFKKA